MDKVFFTYSPLLFWYVLFGNLNIFIRITHSICMYLFYLYMYCIMDNIIYLRHYIFINPNNIFKNIHIDPILTNIKKIHNKNYTNGEIVKYHGYKDIVNCLQN